MQLDDAFPTPWKRVASADHCPLNAPAGSVGASERCGAWPVHQRRSRRMTTGGARPQAAAPAANWDMLLANFGSSPDSVASHISSMIGASPHQPSPCASSHQAVHEQGLCPQWAVSVQGVLCHLPPVADVCPRASAQRRSTSRSTTASALANGSAAAALAHHVLARRTPSWHARHTGAPREQPRLRPACFRARDTAGNSEASATSSWAIIGI